MGEERGACGPSVVGETAAGVALTLYFTTDVAEPSS